MASSTARPDDVRITLGPPEPSQKQQHPSTVWEWSWSLSDLWDKSVDGAPSLDHFSPAPDAPEGPQSSAQPSRFAALARAVYEAVVNQHRGTQVAGELLVAAELGDTNAVNTLLTRFRAKVDGTLDRDSNHPWESKTPLLLAVRNAHFDTAALLLEWGADPNKVDRWGRTPLREAAYNGDVRMVDLLAGAVDLSVRAEPTAGHLEGPLCDAIRGGCPATVATLLSRRANPNTACVRGYRPIEIAIDCLAKLIAPPRADRAPPAKADGAVNVLSARPKAVENHLAICKLLLEANAVCSASAVPRTRLPPLTRAVQSGSVALTRLLLDHKAEVDSNVGRGIPQALKTTQSSLIRRTSPLWYAAAAANHEIVAMLLEEGACPTGWSWGDPLKSAASECEDERCRELLTRSLTAWQSPWSVRTHRNLPKHGRVLVETLLLCDRRLHDRCDGPTPEGRIPRLPLELWFCVLGSATGATWSWS